MEQINTLNTGFDDAIENDPKQFNMLIIYTENAIKNLDTKNTEHIQIPSNWKKSNKLPKKIHIIHYIQESNTNNGMTHHKIQSVYAATWAHCWHKILYHPDYNLSYSSEQIIL